MWDLHPARQVNLWSYYKQLTGIPKDVRGLTFNGATDPLEDFADTRRLLYIEPNEKRREQILARVADPDTGNVVYAQPYRRFQLLWDLITRRGWRVPNL